MANLKTDSIGKLIWCFTIPSLVGTLAITLYNIVDRVFIGQGVGALALSGLGLTFPIMNILSAFSMLVSQGAASVTSIKMGENDETVRRILPNTLLLITICYIVVSAVMLYWLQPILMAFGGSDATIPYAEEYLRIVIPGHIFISLSWGLSNITRAAGKPNLAMGTLVFGAVLNIALDPIFIFVFDMGIEGAAIATVISQAVSAVWVMLFIFGKKNIYRVSKDKIVPDPVLISRIIAVGLAGFIMQATSCLVQIVSNLTLRDFGGDIYVGIMTVLNSIRDIFMLPINSLTNGAQPIISYNFGAGNYNRVKSTFRLVVLSSLLFGIVVTALMIIFVRPVVSVFLSEGSVAYDLCVEGFPIYAAGFVFLAVGLTVIGYFQSVEKSLPATVLTLSRGMALPVAAFLILPEMVGRIGIWLAVPVAELLTVVLIVIFAAMGVFRLRSVQANK